MREMVKPALKLFAICLVCSLCLAVVNAITKDTIKERAEKDAEEKRRLVLGEASSFEELDGWEDMDESGLINGVYAAYNGGTLVGYVFSASPKGFGGEIAVTVGVNDKGKITGVEVGDNNETPGLGSKTADDAFTGQYVDKDVQSKFTVVKRPPASDDEIQAVSGATISSRAVTSAVQASAELAKKLLHK